MPLESVPASTATEAIVAILERDGAVVVSSATTAAVLDAIAAELKPKLALPVDQSPLGNDRFTGLRTLRTSGLMARSAGCRELATHPLILDVLEQVLGPQCSTFQLSWTQAIKIGPGERAQIPHRDTHMYPFARPGPECFVNSIWALTDFTADNGATRVWPGSHRWPDDRIPTPDDPVVAAEMPRGSVILYYGSVFHGGGANASDAARIRVGLAYTLGWLRQEENQYLACPQELARTFPVELQRLMGYAEHFPFLGWHEGADREVLRGGPHRKAYSTALRGRG